MSATFASAASFEGSFSSTSPPPDPIAYVENGIDQLHSLWDNVLQQGNTTKKDDHLSETEAQGTSSTDLASSLPHFGEEKCRVAESGCIPEHLSGTVKEESFPRSALFPFLAHTSAVSSSHTDPVVDPPTRGNEEEETNARFQTQTMNATKNRRTSTTSPSPLPAETVASPSPSSLVSTGPPPPPLPSWLSQPVVLHPVPPLPEALWEQVEKEWKKVGGTEMKDVRTMFYPVGSEMEEGKEEAEEAKRGAADDAPSPPRLSSTTPTAAPMVLPERCQLRVVLGDVKRSLWNLYPVEEERDRMRGYLTYVLIQVLYASPDHVHYTQGEHDLVGAVLFLLCSFRERVAGSESRHTAWVERRARLELVAAVCFALLQTYWAPFASADLEEVQSIASAISFPLAGEHPRLYRALQEVSLLDHPHFMLSWMLTWFVSCLADIPTQMYIVMLFLKGEDALTPLYFSAALVLHGADGLLSALREFRLRCQQEHITSWKDYVYGLLFQRISILPSTLLEAKSASLASSFPSVAGGGSKKMREDKGERVEEVEHESIREDDQKSPEDLCPPQGKEEEEEDVTATGREAAVAAVDTPKPGKDGDVRFPDANTPSPPPHSVEEEAEEETPSSQQTTTRHRTRMTCAVSTSLLLINLRLHTNALRLRYPLKRVDQREGGGGGGGASHEGDPGENHHPKQRSHLGGDDAPPLSSFERRHFMLAIFYLLRNVTLLPWRWLYAVWLHLSGILPPALLTARRVSRPSPPALQRSIVYLLDDPVGKPLTTPTSSFVSGSMVTILPRHAKGLLQRLSHAPPAKVMVAMSVVMVMGLSLLALQQKREVSY